MSKIVEQHVPCPIENCPCGGSSDGFCWYDDGHGWCFSGNKGLFPKDKYNREQFTRCYGTDRGIPTEFMEKFNFHIYVDDDGQTHYHEYVYPEGSKIRRCADKRFFIEGKVPALGGTDMWDPGASPVITVVEGELDAPSAYYMLNEDKRVKVERGVVWLTSASIPKRARKEVYDYLNQFDKVILASETDEAGDGAHAAIAEMLPTKTYKVTMVKHKDANEYLMAGDEDEFKRAWSNAARYVPNNIVNSNEDFFSIVDNIEKDVYVPTPFGGLNRLIKGLPLGHIVLVLGQEGLGKTEILRAFEWSLLSAKEELPIGVLHFEEKQRTTLHGFSCYHLGKNVRDPDTDCRKEVKASIQEWNADGRLHLFDIEEDTSVQSVIETIRYLTVICGCKYIFVDPINQFGSMEIDDTKTKFFDSLAQSMEKFAVKHNVCFVWTAHANDEGKTRDSRMIGKACSIRIEIDRDLEASDPDVKNTTFFRVTKNRFCGDTGAAGQATWDPNTWTLYENEDFDPNAAVSPGGKNVVAF